MVASTIGNIERTSRLEDFSVGQSITSFLSGTTVNRLKFKGFHPLCSIALIALFCLPKLSGKALLTRGTMSVISNYGVPLFFMYSCFAFVKFILNDPFIALASPTCQMWVAYGTPKQQCHLWDGSLTYFRNGSIILLWWTLNNKNGFATERSYMLRLSKNASMSANTVEVILALGEVPKKQGIRFPR